jgi:hypothetical protein
MSFNSSDSGAGGGPYKVQLETDGDLTGYAWSSNVGWIKFGGLTGMPLSGSNASVNTTNGNVFGWVRACAGTVNKDCASATRSDGWDGWISLSGTNYATGNTAGTGGVTYAVDSGTATLKGYSWGSDVVGWLRFSPTTGVDTTVTGGSSSMSLTVGSATVNTSSSGSVTLTANSSGEATALTSWTATAGYSSCQKSSSGAATVTSGWTSGSVANSGSGSILFTNTSASATTKSIVFTCTEGGTPQTRTVNVTVNPYSAPTLSCTRPTRSLQCADVTYSPLPDGYAGLRTDLRTSCPTPGTGLYCVYTCETGYKVNGNRCVVSDIEEI